MKMKLLLLGFCAVSLQLFAAPKIDTLSYGLGYQLGASFHTAKTVLNMDSLLQGIKAGYSGKRPVISMARIDLAMAQFRNHLINTGQEKLKKMSEANLAAGEAFLAKNKEVKGVETLASGLQYKILAEGKGAKPSASDSVTVDYEGTLIDGTVFDSSYKRGEPATFKVNQVIAGWTQALEQMEVGSTWMLYIPANLAYGARGIGPIPPNSVLIFKVHLLKIN